MMAAIVMGSNHEAEQALAEARAALTVLGVGRYSAVYALPDRTGQGPLYLNQAVLLDQVPLSATALKQALQQIEADCGRVRPSRKVRMDLDLIAYGANLRQMKLLGVWEQFPVDVTRPLGELWQPVDV